MLYMSFISKSCCPGSTNFYQSTQLSQSHYQQAPNHTRTQCDDFRLERTPPNFTSTYCMRTVASILLTSLKIQKLTAVTFVKCSLPPRSYDQNSILVQRIALQRMDTDYFSDFTIGMRRVCCPDLSSYVRSV